jgi:hypothetical protein
MMCLGVAGAAIADDDDPVARIGTGVSRGFDHEIGAHVHQHQRLDALDAQDVGLRRAVKGVNAVLSAGPFRPASAMRSARLGGALSR